MEKHSFRSGGFWSSTDEQGTEALARNIPTTERKFGASVTLSSGTYPVPIRQLGVLHLTAWSHVPKKLDRTFVRSTPAIARLIAYSVQWPAPYWFVFRCRMDSFISWGTSTAHCRNSGFTYAYQRGRLVYE